MNLQDSGVEFIAKWIKKWRPKGKFKNGVKLQLYGATANTDINVADMEAGINPIVEFDFDASDVVRQYELQKIRGRNLLMWTVRLSGVGNWSGAADELKDQWHETAIIAEVSGQVR